MKTLLIFCFLTSQLWAKTVVFPAGSIRESQLEETFAHQCLTTTSDNLKCQYLALILKNELSSLLPLLQNFSDEETIRIYREASELEDANIKRLALMYLQSKLSYQDPFLLKMAKSAVYTLDSYLANFAANILRNSKSDEEKSLGNAFEKGKDLSFYTSFSKGIDLAHLQWQVEELKPLQNFAEGIRLPWLDQFTKNATEGSYLMKAQVVTESREALLTQFKALSGLTHLRSLKLLEAEIESVNKELMVLFERMQSGDTSVMPQIQEKTLQIQALGNEMMMVMKLPYSLKELEQGDIFIKDNDVSVGVAIFSLPGIAGEIVLDFQKSE